MICSEWNKKNKNIFLFLLFDNGQEKATFMKNVDV